ncbi:MAG: ComF family protein [Cardiobacteriaceae bacterium]|nr:ComF family protein [Cardiobacteriaceae bacterium]
MLTKLCFVLKALANKALWGFHYYFPPCCVRCEREAVGFLCADCSALCQDFGEHCWYCARRVTWVGGICGRCLQQIPPLDAFFVAKRFGAEVREVILAMKFGRSQPALSVCSGWIRNKALCVDLPQEVVVMALPLSWLRLSFRGFNQAERLAKEVALARGLVMKRGILRRRFRVPQSRLHTHAARKRNIQSAFYCVGEVPKYVLLVDDVATSGATLHEAARCLKARGAIWVGALCVAAKG